MSRVASYIKITSCNRHRRIPSRFDVACKPGGFEAVQWSGDTNPTRCSTTAKEIGETAAKRNGKSWATEENRTQRERRGLESEHTMDERLEHPSPPPIEIQ